MREVASTQPPISVTRHADHIDPRMSQLLIGGVELDGSRYVIEIAGDTIYAGNETWSWHDN